METVKRLVAMLGLVLLVATPAAEAKGTAEVCGASGCMAVTDPGLVGPLRSTFGPAPEPAPAPFYVVRFCSPEGCRGRAEWSYVYAPSPRAMRADNIGSGRVHWMRASVVSTLLADLTRVLEPYPASRSWTPVRGAPPPPPPATRTTPAVWLPVAAGALLVLLAASARGARQRRPDRAG